MLRKIVFFSAEKRYLVIFITIVFIFTSWFVVKELPIDALPDLADTQVIVMAKWEKSPSIIEEQLTYPIITSLLGTAKVKTVRGISDFGYAYIYVIFEDGTDLYWARQRVFEKINFLKEKLPQGVEITLGPDANSLGWIYQYALQSRNSQISLADLRLFQDFTLRYHLQSVSGVAEVASVGGFKKQYQVQVNPIALAQRQISIVQVAEAIRKANEETSAKLIEISGAEYMIRIKGFIKNLIDLKQIVVPNENGIPIPLSELATITEESELRRGVAVLDQESTVGGIVIMRQGENPREVILRIRQKLQEIKLPTGVELVEVYDRMQLVEGAINHLIQKLIEEMVIVALVILIFLWHFPSAIVPILTIPIAVWLSFIPFSALGLQADIMSLSGIAISIGVLVDGAIIEVENAYRKLSQWQIANQKEDVKQVRIKAIAEVTPSVFYSLLAIAVAFLPIFALQEQEGRLFKPLATAKNLTMVLAAILAITVDPAIRVFFSRMHPFLFKPKWLNKIANALLVGKYYPEEKHPVSQFFFRLYNPICGFLLKKPKQIVLAAILLSFLSLFLLYRLKSEFMPPLWEGTLMYMPTTVPGISANQAEKLVLAMNKRLLQHPEVKRVFGKAGRADTATDPAPLSMVETIIELHPPEKWRKVNRFYSNWPSWLQTPFRLFVSERISREELIEELNKSLRFVGVSNSMTMPIKGRLDMLTTGFRTPLGIRIQGGDLETLNELALKIEEMIRQKLKPQSVFAERVTRGYYLEIEPYRHTLGRYGISPEELQTIVEYAVGGEAITQAISGKARFNIAVRYPQDWRNSVEKLKQLPIFLPNGIQVRLKDLAQISVKMGPSMLRNENGFLTAYVYLDPGPTNLVDAMSRVKKLLKENLILPPDVQISYGGQYENLLRTQEKLSFLIPFTVFLCGFLVYLNTQKLWKTLLVLSAIPFSLFGAALALHVANYHLSIAVWVGIIALIGLDLETGIFMLLYLDLAYQEAQKQGKLKNSEALKKVILEGAVFRLRPKLMTVISAMAGLTPILYSDGLGADLMKRIVLPMVGGLGTSFILELLVYPPVYYLIKSKEIEKIH